MKKLRLIYTVNVYRDLEADDFLAEMVMHYYRNEDNGSGRTREKHDSTVVHSSRADTLSKSVQQAANWVIRRDEQP